MDTTQPVTGSEVPDAPELLKPAEVAEVLRLSRMTVYRIINAGEIDVVLVGPRRSIRVTREALDKYLAESDRDLSA